jgi:hypothetical protein
MQWLKEHFIPRKPTGKLVVATHRTDPCMLDVAQENVGHQHYYQSLSINPILSKLDPVYP